MEVTTLNKQAALNIAKYNEKYDGLIYAIVIKFNYYIVKPLNNLLKHEFNNFIIGE